MFFKNKKKYKNKKTIKIIIIDREDAQNKKKIIKNGKIKPKNREKKK